MRRFFLVAVTAVLLLTQVPAPQAQAHWGWHWFSTICWNGKLLYREALMADDHWVWIDTRSRVVGYCSWF